MATILLVDDHQSMRELYTYLLTQRGHTVLCAENGKTALAILAREEIDLVITDINMPEKNGYEFLMELKQFPSRVPVIAMTDKIEAQDYLHIARRLGAAASYCKDEPHTRFLELVDEFVA
ncbi:MAG: response regulator transcription factor [Desulfovibrionales bacterium]